MTLSQCCISKCQGHSSHIAKTCPGHNFLLLSWIWIIFHTIVVLNPMRCHDLDTRSYLQGQFHSAHNAKILFRAITSYCHVGLDPRSFLQVQGHTAHIMHSHKPCPGHNSLLSCWIWIIFHAVVVNDSRVCHDLGFKVISLRSRSHYMPNHNPCPGHISLLSCLVLITLHIIVVHGPRVCHDLDTLSYTQG